MIKIDVNLDAKKTLEGLENFDKLNIHSINKINDNMARRLQARIKEVIRTLPYHQKNLFPHHNTPTSLTETVLYHKQKEMSKSSRTGSYWVEMKKRGRGVNPKWVEFGTSPHEQLTNPIFGAGASNEGQKRPHPGARPSRPFARGVNRFRAKDIPDLKENLNGKIQANAAKVGLGKGLGGFSKL
jgi:hypothetical protein